MGRSTSLIPKGLGEVQHRAAATIFSQVSHVDAKEFNLLEVAPGGMNDERTKWYNRVKPFIKNEAQPGFWFNAEESSEINTISMELKSYASEMRARFIIDGITDASWNEYVSNIENIGGSRLVEIYQVAYDNFYNN